MTKKKVITIGGIFLAFVIAVGGLFVMQGMIQKKSDVLLSETGSIKATLPAEETGENTDNLEKAALSESELIQVLKSMENGTEEQPHEPTQGQISMEQAIKQSKEWADDFYLKYLTEDDSGTLDYIKVSPKLCMKQDDEITVNGSEVLYSYWTVALETDKFEMKIVMNAVTSQVLRATVSSPFETKDFSEIDVSQLLDDYISYFGLKKDELEGEIRGYVYREIEGQELYAITKTESILVANKGGSNSGYEYKNDLTLYLSTRLPN